jgi:predicted dehydrogenase
MPPIELNRRRFLGCSAAATFSLSQGNLAESASSEASAEPVCLGLIGIGNRGTALLRGLLELPGTAIVAVCDPDPRHRTRGQGIVEKAQGLRPDVYEDARRVIERNDIGALVVAVPCDLHESVGCEAIQAGKHLYTEKPLALSLTGCDRLSALAGKRPEQVVHVGFQRRSNPRFVEGVELIKRGDLGPLLEARATWTSSNGPLTGSGGWLGQRDRSGDFMVEQSVHIWDVLHWLHGDVPIRATGWGRRGLFARQHPGRDVTDHYSVELEWADGFRASFFQSWIVPAADGFTGSTLRVLGEDGGLDFGTGLLSFRDRLLPRQSVHPGPQNDTRLALLAFLTSIRAKSPLPPPISLQEARAATLTGLMVRKAVDERRIVTLEEIRAESGTA